MTAAPQRRQPVLICLSLAVATLAVYWPVCHFGFVNYDDDLYITRNPHLQGGLSFKGLAWAVTTPLDHWMPVTWLARMLVYQLFGLDAGAHHLVNVLFHIANVVLLFCLLNRMTGALWRSAFVAALFALHPLHVESVAWVTEFKNVLSTCFWMLTVWAYVRYVERSNAPQYWLAVGLYVLGLMTKPMLVTLPFTLLLLDFWPLGRTRWAQAAVGKRTPTDIKGLIWEKLPFIILSLALSVITYSARATGPFASDVKSIPLFLRISHAAVSYVRYIVKTVWPVNLAVFYPHPFYPRPEVWRLPEAVLAALAVVGLTVFLCRTARQNPPLTVGWLWYLGTLVPVIGLVQDGGQSIADRFTYVPSIGLFTMAAWGLSKLVSGRVRAEMVAKGLAAGVIIALLLSTRHQLQYWANSVFLFQHAIAVTQGNYIAENNLGVALRERGQMEQAATHFQRAIDIWPEYNEPYKNLADILLQMGRFDEAIPYYRRLLERKPGWSEVHNSLGVALVQQGKLEEALGHFTRAAELDPRDPLSQRNLAIVLSRLGRSEPALEHAIRAVQLNPQDAQAQDVMELLLKKSGPKTQGVVPAADALTPDAISGPP